MLSFYFNTSKETGCVQIQRIRIIGIVSEILGGNTAEEGIGIDFHIETGGNKNIDAAENRRSIDHAVTVDHRASEIAFEAAENRVELRAFKGFSVVIQCAAGKSGGGTADGTVIRLDFFKNTVSLAAEKIAEDHFQANNDDDGREKKLPEQIKSQNVLATEQ